MSSSWGAAESVLPSPRSLTGSDMRSRSSTATRVRFCVSIPTSREPRFVGMGFDRDVLVRAGIERADAFAAVSSGDNSNIISARVARETFGVERVVARIYDAKRAAVYERLGIPTVATVPWSTDRFLHTLTQDSQTAKWRDPFGHCRDYRTCPARGLGRQAVAYSRARPVRESRSSSDSAPACSPIARPSSRPTTRSTSPPYREPSPKRSHWPATRRRVTTDGGRR